MVGENAEVEPSGQVDALKNKPRRVLCDWNSIRNYINLTNMVALSTILTCVLGYVLLRYQYPEQFGLAPRLIYFTVSRNRLDSDKDLAIKFREDAEKSNRGIMILPGIDGKSDLLPTETTVTIENPSTRYSALNVEVLIALLGDAPAILHVHEGIIKQVDSQDINIIYESEVIPPMGRVAFTVTQNVECIPGEEDTEHPPAVRYQYVPEVVSVRYQHRDAERDVSRCIDDIERYSSDRLADEYEAYVALYEPFANLEVIFVDQSGQESVQKVGHEYTERLAAQQRNDKRFIAGKREKCPAFVRLTMKDKSWRDSLKSVKDLKIRISDAAVNNATNEWYEKLVEMIRRYVDENPAVAERWLLEYPQANQLMQDPHSPIMTGPPVPMPWEIMLMFAEENPDIIKKWIRKYPQARMYLEELKSSDYPENTPFPPKLPVPPPWDLEDN